MQYQIKDVYTANYNIIPRRAQIKVYKKCLARDVLWSGDILEVSKFPFVAILDHRKKVIMSDETGMSY
jgi:hypothetical protein